MHGLPHNNTHRLFHLLVLLTTLVVSPFTAATKPTKRPDSYPPVFPHNRPATYPVNSNPFGTSYAEWGTQWWQWALSIPANVNPLGEIITADPKQDSRCMVGQHGPVWFLAGTLGADSSARRSCTVPAGVALFFPVINTVDINTTHQTATEIAPVIDAAYDLSVTLDGKPVADVRKFRVKSTVFAITLPADNLFGGALPDGVYSPVVADGYYVMLKPLKPLPQGKPINWPFPARAPVAACSISQLFLRTSYMT